MDETDQRNRLQPRERQSNHRRIGVDQASQGKSVAANGECRFKASSADIRTKVLEIKANARKYSISALCRCLGIARSTFYYECHDPIDESDLEEAIQTAYDENRRVYGQRKLKRVLFRKGWTVSRRRIGRSMAKRGLVSAYTCKKYRVHSSKNNEAAAPNLLAGDFKNQAPGACIVSDLTYVQFPNIAPEP